MKSIILKFLLCFTYISTFAQEPKDIMSRKGKLFLTVGTEYRITPIYNLDGEISQLGLATSIDSQNSGVAFNYGFDYFVTKNLSLNFGHSLRYDYLIRPFSESELPFSFEPVEKTLISDFHFYLEYHFQIFKEGELFIRLGKTLANRNTDIIERRTLFDQNGDSVGIFSITQDFQYQPSNFALGYKKNNLSVSGGVYTSSVTNYFNDGTSFVIPYISLKYNLFRF